MDKSQKPIDLFETEEREGYPEPHVKGRSEGIIYRHIRLYKTIGDVIAACENGQIPTSGGIGHALFLQLVRLLETKGFTFNETPMFAHFLDKALRHEKNKKRRAEWEAKWNARSQEKTENQQGLRREFEGLDELLKKSVIFINNGEWVEVRPGERIIIHNEADE